MSAEEIIAEAESLEDELQADAGNVEVLVSLMVLYWQATEFGFNAGHALPLSFIDRAAERLVELLELCRRLFPDIPQCSFWAAYIRWLEYGEDIPEAAFDWIRQKIPSYLEPWIYWQADKPSELGAAQLRELIASLVDDQTVRAKYVLSVSETLCTAELSSAS